VPGFGYSDVSPAEQPRWKEFFRARLAESRSATRLQMVWRAVVGLSDDGALAIAAQKLHAVPLAGDFERQIVCDASAMARATRAEAWTEFQQAAQPWETLGDAARAVLTADGAGCAR
jgi:hypothetical protein